MGVTLTVTDLPVRETGGEKLESGVRMWWLGQAGFLLRSSTATVLIDAYLSDSLAVKYRGRKFPHRRMVPVPVSPGDLTDLSHVLFCLPSLIKAFQSMRGISLIVAATLAAELGDFSRFERADQIMAYLGLIPSEHSSGDKQRKGSITKTGNSHVRKALIEAAQAYRLPARKSRVIQKRQEGVPKEICDISWKAQCRLCGRYKKLTGRGKNTNVVKTAIARELAGFAWAIARELPLAA